MKNILVTTNHQNHPVVQVALLGQSEQRGFTLVEVMVVLIIVAILAAIAFPSYQAYARRASAAQAQQEIQRLAEQLERHKAKNFSYKGFDPAYIYGANAPMNSVIVPIGATGAKIKYTLTIRDLQSTTKLLTDSSVRGQGWTIMATVNNDPKNYNLLMTSEGLRCKNAATISYTACGSGSEGW